MHVNMYYMFYNYSEMFGGTSTRLVHLWQSIVKCGPLWRSEYLCEDFYSFRFYRRSCTGIQPHSNRFVSIYLRPMCKHRDWAPSLGATGKLEIPGVVQPLSLFTQMWVTCVMLCCDIHCYGTMNRFESLSCAFLTREYPMTYIYFFRRMQGRLRDAQ